jgi:hypothetical protein
MTQAPPQQIVTKKDAQNPPWQKSSAQTKTNNHSQSGKYFPV